MKILLYSNKTVEEIKEEFCQIYPYLKITFFPKEQNACGVLFDEELESSTVLRSVNGAGTEETEINPVDTIKEVAQKFRKIYGLAVRIFRKQRDTWMDTAITDDLTLHEQDTWGRESSKPLKIKINNNSDWNSYSLRK